MPGLRNAGFLTLIMLSTLLMGSSFPSAAVLLSAGADPLSLVSIRFFVASLVAWSLLGFFATSDEKRVSWNKACLIGFFQTFGVMAPVHVALESEAPPVVAAIVFSNVLMVAGYEMFTGRRQTTPALLTAIALGIGGLIFVTNLLAMPSSDDLKGSHLGVFLSLLAALSWTLATLLSKHLKVAGGWRFNAQQMLVGAVCLIALTVFWRGATIWLPQSIHDTAWLIWLSIPASVISFGLWFRALALRSATEASAWLAAVPAFAAVIAWLSLGSELTRLQLLGMGCIAAALYLQSRAARDRP
jgi:drug/metabolite transporter (DMT)-like permease